MSKCQANMKERIFVGPHITHLFEEQNFSSKLNSTQRIAWEAFENICRNFLGNEKRKVTVKLCRS